MKIYKLTREQLIARPRKAVFEFFERPENLAVITPPSMRFHILTPRPIVMRFGAVIDYKIGIMGITTGWRTLIAGYSPPDSFVDFQINGPYRLWRHTHRFIDRGDSTVIVDEIEYAVPMGILGQLAHAVFVERRLEAIFNYRAAAIARIFAMTPDYKSSVPAGAE